MSWLDTLGNAVFDGLKAFLCYVVTFFLELVKPFLLWIIRDVMPWDMFAALDMPLLSQIVSDVSLIIPVAGVVVLLSGYGSAYVTLFALQKVLKALPTVWG